MYVQVAHSSMFPVCMHQNKRKIKSVIIENNAVNKIQYGPYLVIHVHQHLSTYLNVCSENV